MSAEGPVTEAANNQNQQNQNQATQIANKVKKNLGLQQTNQGFVATNLSGNEQFMYGEEASEQTKIEAENAGLGTITPQGSFQNVIKGPDGKMQIVSNAGSILGTSGAMGTGESTVMGQLPISKKMFEQQKKIQMIATGAMALTGVPLMGAAFMDYNSKKYSDYVNKFNNTIQSSTSLASSQKIESGSTNKTSTSMASSVTAEDDIGVDGGFTEAERLKKLALTKKAAALKGKRNLFETTNQTIEGAMA